MDLQELLALVKTTQAEQKWDVTALIRVGGVVAVKLNSVQNLTGLQKKNLVCQVLVKSLEAAEEKECAAQGVSTEEKEKIQARFADLKQATATVLPASLDLAVAAARGKLDLKKVSPPVWAQAFSCCVKSTVSVLASQNLISESHAQQALQLEKKLESVVPLETTAAGTGIATQVSQKKTGPEVA